jgi:hypothetical protein
MASPHPARPDARSVAHVTPLTDRALACVSGCATNASAAARVARCPGGDGQAGVMGPQPHYEDPPHNGRVTTSGPLMGCWVRWWCADQLPAGAGPPRRARAPSRATAAATTGTPAHAVTAVTAVTVARRALPVTASGTPRPGLGRRHWRQLVQVGSLRLLPQGQLSDSAPGLDSALERYARSLCHSMARRCAGHGKRPWQTRSRPTLPAARRGRGGPQATRRVHREWEPHAAWLGPHLMPSCTIDAKVHWSMLEQRPFKLD